jgi:hypothetical protein
VCLVDLPRPVSEDNSIVNRFSSKKGSLGNDINCPNHRPFRLWAECGLKKVAIWQSAGRCRRSRTDIESRKREEGDSQLEIEWHDDCLREEGWSMELSNRVSLLNLEYSCCPLHLVMLPVLLYSFQASFYGTSTLICSPQNQTKRSQACQILAYRKRIDSVTMQT